MIVPQKENPFTQKKNYHMDSVKLTGLKQMVTPIYNKGYKDIPANNRPMSHTSGRVGPVVACSSADREVRASNPTLA